MPTGTSLGISHFTTPSRFRSHKRLESATESRCRQKRECTGVTLLLVTHLEYECDAYKSLELPRSLSAGGHRSERLRNNASSLGGTQKRSTYC